MEFLFDFFFCSLDGANYRLRIGLVLGRWVIGSQDGLGDGWVDGWVGWMDE